LMRPSRVELNEGGDAVALRLRGVGTSWLWREDARHFTTDMLAWKRKAGL